MSRQYFRINILDLLSSLGEDQVKQIFCGFSCSKNPEIEYFLFHNAVDFAQRKLSITYLIFDEQERFVGYYTLTHKTARILCNSLSKSGEKKLSRYSQKDKTNNCFDVSAFLIAQFGKNDAIDSEKCISGDELMLFALEDLKLAQYLVGGGVIFLECENKEKLIQFYKKHNFIHYGYRKSSDQIEYLQFMKLF